MQQSGWQLNQQTCETAQCPGCSSVASVAFMYSKKGMYLFNIVLNSCSCWRLTTFSVKVRIVCFFYYLILCVTQSAIDRPFYGYIDITISFIGLCTYRDTKALRFSGALLSRECLVFPQHTTPTAELKHAILTTRLLEINSRQTFPF